MNHVATIAAASIREHTRRKLVLAFAIVALLLALPMVYFALKSSDREIFFGSTRSLAVTLSQGLMGTMALIAALTVSMGNVGQPFSSGEAVVVLARPVARWQYVLGRFLGSAAVIWGLCIFMGLILQLVGVLDGLGFSEVMAKEWYVQAFNLTIVSAITTLASTFISVAPAAAVVGFLTQTATGLIAFVYRISETMKFNSFLATAAKIGWYATPKYLSSPLALEATSELQNAPGGGPGGRSAAFMIVPQNTMTLFFWALGYLVLILALSIWITNRKEVK